eukprot:scaffold86256_cov20-Tisochrysis_lutea.AAC.1
MKADVKRTRRFGPKTVEASSADLGGIGNRGSRREGKPCDINAADAFKSCMQPNPVLLLYLPPANTR